MSEQQADELLKEICALRHEVAALREQAKTISAVSLSTRQLLNRVLTADSVLTEFPAEPQSPLAVGQQDPVLTALVPQPSSGVLR